ncbi:MAG TPA: response regulator transcription factor [Streptosporangiaceae bacterium]
MVRAGFCGIIAATPGYTVVGEASNGREAVEVVSRTRPDVVLMDVRMPDMDGIEATRRITGASPASRDGAPPGPRVLILTTFDLDEYVFSALRAGASGFLLKSTQPADLLSAIRVIADGDSLLAPSVTRRLVAEFVRHPAGPGAAGADGTAGPASGGPGTGGTASGGTASAETAGRAGDGLAGITSREREVLALIATGLSNAEIARHLSITSATAKTHVGHLLTKLAARDRVHLVIIAYQAGLVTVGLPPSRRPG